MINSNLREVDHENIDFVWQPENNQYPSVLSILIPTLTDRKYFFNHITSRLLHQIEHYKLQNDIEIVSFLDDRDYTVGYKRNVLIRQSMGKYIVFIDDDDDVSDDYIIDIYQALQKNLIVFL